MLASATRVWCDGCFDTVHFGHANSLRQAKCLGDVLVVGAHNDEEITKFKGPPVFTEQERYEMLRAVKWVNELVEGSTYWPNETTLQQNNCAYAAHGDDISVATDGRDPYERLKERNMLRIFERTKGTSTTDIVKRIIDPIYNCSIKHKQSRDIYTNFIQLFAQPCDSNDQEISVWQFIANNSTFIPVTNNELKRHGTVGYISGHWDLFHPGHLSLLKSAREVVDYLIVGVLSDQPQNTSTEETPRRILLNVHERALSLLATTLVDELILDVPEDFETYSSIFKIDKFLFDDRSSLLLPSKPENAELVHASNTLTTDQILNRVIKNRHIYEERNDKKEARENYLTNKI